jgi:hypothetical protein
MTAPSGPTVPRCHCTRCHCTKSFRGPLCANPKSSGRAPGLPDSTFGGPGMTTKSARAAKSRIRFSCGGINSATARLAANRSFSAFSVRFRATKTPAGALRARPTLELDQGVGEVLNRASRDEEALYFRLQTSSQADINSVLSKPILCASASRRIIWEVIDGSFSASSRSVEIQKR